MVVVLPHVTPGDPLRISASTFVTWKKCPDSANARLQGHFGPDSRPAFLGGLAHRVFSRHLTDGPIPADEFARTCKQEIGDSNLNFKMGGLEIKPSTLNTMIEEVRELYERFVRFPSDGFDAAEVPLRHETDDGVELVGTVDAVYREEIGGHRLVDWKTGELGDVEDQLGFYSLLWALENDQIPAAVEAVSVRTGERHHSSPTIDDVNRTANDVATMVTGIRVAWAAAERAERRAGPWCRYCPILEDCPEGRAVDELLG